MSLIHGGEGESNVLVTWTNDRPTSHCGSYISPRCVVVDASRDSLRDLFGIPTFHFDSSMTVSQGVSSPDETSQRVINNSELLTNLKVGQQLPIVED